MLSLYIHIPFCNSKCSYCDFVSGYKPEKEILDRYTEFLCLELALISKSYDIREDLSTIYLGGGTPSLLDEKNLAILMDSIFHNFHTDIHEATIEVNPENVNKDKSLLWEKYRFNRISLGFQSMNNGTLEFLGRKNKAEINKKAFFLLRDTGFDNISVDVILSIRNDDIYNTLEEIERIKPEHISAYNLSIEEKTLLYTRFKKNEYIPLDDTEYLNNYWKTVKYLTNLGYIHYEISNFALKNEFFSLHNMNYWNYGEYYGAGLGASGFLNNRSENYIGFRWTNTANMNKYFNMIENSKLPVEFSENIDLKTSMKEFIMVGLRKRSGIDLQVFEEIYNFDFTKIVNSDYLNEYSKFIEIKNNYLVLTDEGLNITNSIITFLWERIDNNYKS